MASPSKADNPAKMHKNGKEATSNAGLLGKRTKKKISSDEKAHLCTDAVTRLKAIDVLLLDVSSHSSFADYFLICSGKSSRQVQGLADKLESELRDEGIRPLGIEGRQEGQWVLMDYGDLIVHIFYEPVRRFYNLESLWSEAKRVRCESSSAPEEDSEEED
jgi:ribosome-associated protein